MRTLVSFLLCLQFIQNVHPHVRLMEPPARNVLWRTHPELPKHEDDDYLICTEEGKKECPPCGDSSDDRSPYSHQAGGKWAYGIIERNYTEGETIPVKVSVTNSHGGYIQFKLCPNNDVRRPVSQRCLDEYPLEVLGHKRGKIAVTAPYQEKQKINLELVLPRGVFCEQCIIQMTQYTEQFKPSKVMFRNCADIAIQEARSKSSKSDSRYNNLGSSSDTFEDSSFQSYNPNSRSSSSRDSQQDRRILNHGGSSQNYGFDNYNNQGNHQSFQQTNSHKQIHFPSETRQVSSQQEGRFENRKQNFNNNNQHEIFDSSHQDNNFQPHQQFDQSVFVESSSRNRNQHRNSNYRNQQEFNRPVQQFSSHSFQQGSSFQPVQPNHQASHDNQNFGNFQSYNTGRHH